MKEATCGEGPTMKRMMTRARGSGSRILKRSSHIRIILTDEIEIKTRDKSKKSRRVAQRSAAAKKAALMPRPPKVAKEPTVARGATPQKPAVRNQKSKSWDRKLIQSVSVSG